MRNKTIGLLGLVLAELLLCGCATDSIVTRVNKPDRSLVVVPVKGRPIDIKNIHIGGLLVGPIELALTKNSSEVLCARLNQYTSFNGERILAEETAKLLRTSPKVAFHDIIIDPLDSAMPGIKNLGPKEQQRFMTGWPDSELTRITGRYYFSRPITPTTPTNQYVVSLEVTLAWLCLNHNDSLEGDIVIRMIDLETGKIIRRGSCHRIFKITEVTGNSDLQIFESDFRQCMNKSAKYLLSTWNLL